MDEEEKRNSPIIVIDKNSEIGKLLEVATIKGRTFNTIHIWFKEKQAGFAEKFFTFLISNGWYEIGREKSSELFKEKVIMRGKIEYEDKLYTINKVTFERIPQLRVRKE